MKISNLPLYSFILASLLILSSFNLVESVPMPDFIDLMTPYDQNSHPLKNSQKHYKKSLSHGSMNAIKPLEIKNTSEPDLDSSFNEKEVEENIEKVEPQACKYRKESIGGRIVRVLEDCASIVKKRTDGEARNIEGFIPNMKKRLDVLSNDAVLATKGKVSRDYGFQDEIEESKSKSDKDASSEKSEKKYQSIIKVLFTFLWKAIIKNL